MRKQRVIERLIYEDVLLHNRFEGRRWPIRLQDLIEAGEKEPRILEVLPAIIRLKPKIIQNLKKDLPNYPHLKTLVNYLDRSNAPKQWKKIPIEDYRRQLERLTRLWTHQKSKNKWRNLNLRVSEENLKKLEELCEKLGQTNKSEIVRNLIEQAVS